MFCAYCSKQWISNCQFRQLSSDLGRRSCAFGTPGPTGISDYIASSVIGMPDFGGGHGKCPMPVCYFILGQYARSCQHIKLERNSVRLGFITK